MIELQDIDDQKTYAYYDSFSIGPGAEGYTLNQLGEYNGSAGDSLRSSVNQPFNTFDTGSVAGGWWNQEDGNR